MAPTQPMTLTTGGSNLSILEESRTAIGSLPLPASHATYSALLSQHREFLSSISLPGSLTSSLLAATTGPSPLVPPSFLYPHLYAAAAASGAVVPAHLPFLPSDPKTLELLRSRAPSESDVPPPVSFSAISASLALPPPPSLSLSSVSCHPRVERPVPISAAPALLAMEGHRLLLRDLNRRQKAAEKLQEADAERIRDCDPERCVKIREIDNGWDGNPDKLMQKRGRETDKGLDLVQVKAYRPPSSTPPSSPPPSRSRGSSPHVHVMSPASGALSPSPPPSTLSKREGTLSSSSSKSRRSDHPETVTVWRPY